MIQSIPDSVAHPTQAPHTLSGAQRRQLKQRAFALKPVVLLGQKGLTDAVHAEIDVALDAHELIKIRLTGATREERATLRECICQQHGATLIARIGYMISIYRKRPAKKAR